MFLVSKDKNTVINVNQVSALYISADRCNIRVEMTNGKPWNIGRYDTESITAEALKIIAEKLYINREQAIYVPEDAEIRARIANLAPDIETHLANGKKIKGHGGS